MADNPDLSSLTHHSWDSAFNDIDGRLNPESSFVFVSKSSVGDIPPYFEPKEGIFQTYRHRAVDGEYIIRDLGTVFVVTKSSGAIDDIISDIQGGLPQSQSPPTIESSNNETPFLQSSDDNNISLGQIAVAGLLIYLGYKGVQGLAKVAAELEVDTNDSSGSPPQLARTASKLENKQYNVFISHSWNYDDHYSKIAEFLDEVPSLNWQNHSVPSTDPLDATTDEALRRELRNQMKTASVVVVSSGMYAAYSNWIPEELDMARAMEKPVIAIRPNGQTKVPTKIQEAADELIGWRKASLVDALAKHG